MADVAMVVRLLVELKNKMMLWGVGQVQNTVQTCSPLTLLFQLRCHLKLLLPHG